MILAWASPFNVRMINICDDQLLYSVLCNGTNDALMLAHRLRRWPNIKISLFQCHVLAGLLTPLTGRGP